MAMTAAARLRRLGGMPLSLLNDLRGPSGDLSSPEGRARERRRRVLLSAMMSMAAKIVSVGTALVTIPITLHYLGPERYGMWMIMSSLIAMLSFADLGIGSGILNTVAAAYGRDDLSTMRGAVSSGFVALTVMAVVILGVFWTAYPHVEWNGFFNVRTPLARSEAGPAVAAFALCFAASIPITIVQRVQMGMQRSFVAAAWLCAGSLFTLPAILIAVHFQAGLPILVAILMGAPLLAGLVNSLMFFGFQHPGLRPVLRDASMAEIGSAVRSGSYFILIQLGNSVIAGCIPIVIAHAAGPAMVAQYSVPDRLLSLVVMLVSMYVQPLWPAYREALVRGDVHWVRQTYASTLVRVLCVVAVILTILGVMMPVILRFWVGSVIQPSAILIAGLCVYKVMESLLWVNAILLNGMNALRFQSLLALVAAPTFVTVVYFACLYGGVSAVPWAGALATGLVTLLAGTIVTRRRLQALSTDPEARP